MKRICPVCKREIHSSKVIEIQNNYEILACPHCDVFFADPFRGFETKQYEQHCVPPKLDWNHLQFLKMNLCPIGKLLDIGCGTGRFLHEARTRGYNVWGIDISSSAIESARIKFGLNKVYHFTLENFVKEFPQEKFDIITMFEVLEHLDNPQETILQVYSLLKPNGYLAISVPNRNRRFEFLPEGTDIPPNHLTRWNSKALKNFLSRNKFEVLKIVIKKIDVEELSLPFLNRVGLRIASNICQKGQMLSNTRLIALSNLMKNAKETVVRSVCFPLSFLYRFIGYQGWNIYCLSRRY